LDGDCTSTSKKHADASNLVQKRLDTGTKSDRTPHVLTDIVKGGLGKIKAKDRSLRQLLQGEYESHVGAAEGCDLLLF
jgi:hypothetical protein